MMLLASLSWGRINDSNPWELGPGAQEGFGKCHLEFLLAS